MRLKRSPCPYNGQRAFVDGTPFLVLLNLLAIRLGLFAASSGATDPVKRAHEACTESHASLRKSLARREEKMNWQKLQLPKLSLKMRHGE